MKDLSPFKFVLLLITIPLFIYLIYWRWKVEAQLYGDAFPFITIGGIIFLILMVVVLYKSK